MLLLLVLFYLIGGSHPLFRNAGARARRRSLNNSKGAPLRHPRDAPLSSPHSEAALERGVIRASRQRCVVLKPGRAVLCEKQEMNLLNRLEVCVRSVCVGGTGEECGRLAMNVHLFLCTHAITRFYYLSGASDINTCMVLFGRVQRVGNCGRIAPSLLDKLHERIPRGCIPSIPV